MADREDWQGDEEEEEYNDDGKANSLEDELSDDEDEEEVARKKPAKKEVKKKKKRSAFIDDAAEEEEDPRKLKRSRFIDDIAEVDDEDEEDDDEEDGMDDLIADEGEVPDASDMAEVRRAIREAEIQAQKDEEINPEELQKYLQQRFGRDRMAAYDASIDHGEGAGSAVSQQALMPTPRDPKLWVIRCAEGAEREVVVCLLQKCYDYAAKGQPLLIKSVFCKDQLKGYLYIEAFKEAPVKEALKGMRSVFQSIPPKLVPLGEMVSAITVPRSAQRAVQPGSWVRPKTGVYKGDLAKVVSVDINAGRATIKMVPRLDFAAIAARRAEGRRGFEKAPKIRPAQRAFNPDEARSFQMEVQQQRDRSGEIQHILNNSQRFSRGYLIKTVAIKSLNLEDGIPPLDELQRFNSAQQDGDDGMGGAGDLTSLVQDLGVEGTAALEAAVNARFEKGDRVIVREGDLKGILGKVELVTEDGQIMVRPVDDSLGDFKDAIGFAPRELFKWFESGDHVKVAHGSHAGETGMVVKMDEGVCYVLTDATREEIKVFARDLVDAVAAPSTADKIGDYDLFDLVVLDPQTVGVIVGVEKETCKVLTNTGEGGKPDIRVCRLPDLKRKINNRRASAQDGAKNEVNINDIVQIEEGPLRGQSATVKHIMRGYLFVQSRQISENGGYACVLARSCHVRGGQSKQAAGGGGFGHVMATPAPSRILGTPAYGGGVGGGNVMASPSHNSGGGRDGPRYGGDRGGGYSGRQMTQQDRTLEGKRMQVKRGAYRSMWGTIKSATATHVRMELEAQMKTVSIEKSCLDLGGAGGSLHRAPMGMGGGAAMGMGMGYNAAMGGGYGNAPGGRTPAHEWSGGGTGTVMQTPAHYSSYPTSTPLHASMGGVRDSVTKTPGYDAAWAMTPAHEGFGSGGYDDAPQTMPGYGAPMGGGSEPRMVGYGGGMSMPGYDAAPVSAQRSGDGGGGGGGGAEQGPLPGSSAQDWKGLEVELASGARAVVRSVGNDGQASVQVGNLEGKNYVFANGSVHSVPVKDLKLVMPGLKDTLRVLSGKDYGLEGVITVVDGEEVFINIDGKPTIFPVKICGKVGA